MYHAGWGKQEIEIQPQGYAMFGYGQWHHRAYDRRTPLYARALYVADASGQAIIFCCLDMGCVTGAMRIGVCDALLELWGQSFNESALILTATHTHSGPGGCSFEALYNLPTPGFVPAHVAAVVSACVSAILTAQQTAAPTALMLGHGHFGEETPVAWNRSLPAYNRNPDVVKRTPAETHLALDRAMAVLSLQRTGEVQALLSLFGVHATCLGNDLHSHDGDNKGYAAAHAEQCLAEAGVAHPVAIFAQATAGDVSPHYHGKGDVARRKLLKGDAEVAYAVQNGLYQSICAQAALTSDENVVVEGEIDAILRYIDFSAIHAAAEFTGGDIDAWTSDPCHGTAFFQGTPVDGPGASGVLITPIAKLADAVRALRLSPLMRRTASAAYYRRLYAAQGVKSIMLETGRKLIFGRPMGTTLPSGIDPLIGELKRQIQAGAIIDSPLVPTHLPIQIVVLGQLALVCCPGEFTTTAGRRLLDSVRARLTARGIEHVLICTYCNDYMGYVTTQEEYQQQAYEGGHTLFGQWTLAAFQTSFADLAAELSLPAPARSHDHPVRPHPVPSAELAKRSALAVPR